jgi:glycosyltransferase involved in cell wall biosynthesis
LRVRLLVPLPFDISDMAHGRNLRIAHLLQAMQNECEVLCVTPDECTALAARRVMPGVTVQAADSPRGTETEERIIGTRSFMVRRSLSFLGYDAALADATRRLTVSADVVVGFDMPSVAYLLVASLARGTGSRPCVVCDLIDDPWLLRKSLPRGRRWSSAGLKTLVAMQVIRHRVLPRLDSLIAVAPQDAATLARASRRPTSVVPNGADVDPEAADRWPREPLVVFTGSMSFPANEAAACFMAREVWPLVLASHRCGLGGSDGMRGESRLPTLAIVGANPTPAVEKLATLPRVVVTGRVPSIHEWLSRSQVAVAPMLSGTGIKNKILEACAAGCPVVATSKALGGLPRGQDVGIIAADGAERIAAEVFRLLDGASLARRTGSAGLEMVRTRFSWPRVAADFLRVLRGESLSPTDSTGSGVTRAADCTTQNAENEEAVTHAAS